MEKVFCSKCSNETNQELVHDSECGEPRAIYISGKPKEVGWLYETNIWNLYRCRGCSWLNLEIITKHMGTDSERREVGRILFPGKSKRREEGWIFCLENEYIELLSEVYGAFNRGSYRLAIMGARTIIDMFVVDNIGDKGSFAKKLSSLAEGGFVSKDQHGLLEKSVDAGSAAAHRGFKPSEEMMNSVIEVIEHLLKPIALKIRMNEYEHEIPKRKKPNK